MPNPKPAPLLIDGKKCRAALSGPMQKAVRSLLKAGVTPHLLIVSLGSDPASQVYIQNKKRFGESLGCKVSVEAFLDASPLVQIEEVIARGDADPSVHGIIVQAPVPKEFSFEALVEKILPEKDVDGLKHGSPFTPATARAVMSLLSFYDTPVSGKYAVVVGRSRLAGRPIAEALLSLDATVTVCHSKTANLAQFTKKADILIVAIGRPEFIGLEHVGNGQVIVDVGIHRKDGSFVGDVSKEASLTASALTPVPGGVGPMTVLSLFENLILAAESASGKKEMV